MQRQQTMNAVGNDARKTTNKQVECNGRHETTTNRSRRTADKSGGRDGDARRRQGVRARHGARGTHALDKDTGCGHVVVMPPQDRDVSSVNRKPRSILDRTCFMRRFRGKFGRIFRLVETHQALRCAVITTNVGDHCKFGKFAVRQKNQICSRLR